MCKVRLQQSKTFHLLLLQGMLPLPPLLLLLLLRKDVKYPAIDEIVDTSLSCSTNKRGRQAPVKPTDLQSTRHNRHTMDDVTQSWCISSSVNLLLQM
jgi:hypothetical protein